MILEDVAKGLVGKGERMDDEMEVSPKVKEKALKALESLKEMLEKDGVDPMEFIEEHMGMAKEESESPKKPKALVIAMLKKKNGEEE